MRSKKGFARATDFSWRKYTPQMIDARWLLIPACFRAMGNDLLIVANQIILFIISRRVRFSLRHVLWQVDKPNNEDRARSIKKRELVHADIGNRS